MNFNRDKQLYNKMFRNVYDVCFITIIHGMKMEE